VARTFHREVGHAGRHNCKIDEDPGGAPEIDPAACDSVTATLASAVHAAEVRAAEGDPSGAATGLAGAVAAATRRLGPDHLDVLAAAYRLAALQRQAGALPEARRVLESAQEVGRRIHGEAHPLLLSITYELAVVAHELGNAYEAGRNFATLRRLGPDVLGADHAYVLAARDHERGLTPVPAPVVSTVDEATPDEPSERGRRTVVAATVAGALALALVGVAALVFMLGHDRTDRSTGTAAAPVVSPSGAGEPADLPSPGPGASGSEGAPVAGAAPPAPAANTPRPSLPAPAPATTGPGTIGGRYLIHAAHTNLCVGEGPELFKNTGRTVLGQHPCASASPAITLEAVAPNVYRILLARPGGQGCADVDYGGTGPGLLLAAQDCVDGRADQRFTWEPVNAPAAGYRLRSVAGAKYCIGVLEGKTQSGVQIMQADCAGRTSEIFTLERR
jgi:hypothetical protein